MPPLSQAYEQNDINREIQRLQTEQENPQITNKVRLDNADKLKVLTTISYGGRRRARRSIKAGHKSRRGRKSRRGGRKSRRSGSRRR